MVHKYWVGAVDRLCGYFCDNTLPFGGKKIFVTVVFRQIILVIPERSNA